MAVETEITYLAPGSFINRRFVAPSREVNTGEYLPYAVTIRDARPRADTIATGVEITSAQGHATTSRISAR